MAKGLRSSRNKANNVKLRFKVFGPVENARKERLSAKLLELATKPKPKEDEDTEMDLDEKCSLSLPLSSSLLPLSSPPLPLSSCWRSGKFTDFGIWQCQKGRERRM